MVTLYVEGGGPRDGLRSECRQGFASFFEKTELKDRRPRVVACGSRNEAYDSFCTAIRTGKNALLLVDSEDLIDARHQQGLPENWQPWSHLNTRDQWQKPARAVNSDCHLMVVCMESWFLADRDELQAFFGQGFNANALPAAANRVETIAKVQIYRSLSNATRTCKTKLEYGKGAHSFKLLARINPTLVTAASPWAKRLIDELCRRMPEVRAR